MPISASELMAGSTVVLVILTAYYAYQTRRTAELMANQFRRESLRYHSQVLRDIVIRWLERLPTVTATDIESPSEISIVGHPAIEDDVDHWEGWFWVTPHTLRDDPFFEDLIENHAVKLKQIKESIISKFDRFWQLRDEFISEYSDPTPLDELPFSVEKSVWYEFWVFENTLLLERGIRTKDEIYEEIVQSNQNLNWAQTPPIKIYVGGHNEREILRCEVLKGDAPTNAETIDGADEQVYTALRRVIERVRCHKIYSNSDEAASTLDDLAELVNRLEITLEEYQGMEIYEGECDYIFSIN